MSERIKTSPTEATTVVLPDGSIVTTTPVPKYHASPGEVAWHESYHAVASGSIVEANIIPSGNALGTTTPVFVTPAGAAAAAAMGFSGTGWDQFVTEYYLGTDWGAAKNVAKLVLKDQGDLVYEVASMLEERKRITQMDMEEAKQNVADKESGIYGIEVTIYHADSYVATFTTESFHGEVIVEHQPQEPEPETEEEYPDMLK